MILHACIQSAQNINLPAINVVVMQMPEYADSSAENRQGPKMNVPRAPEIRLLPVIELHYSHR
jgi:hypothetical protein